MLKTMESGSEEEEMPLEIRIKDITKILCIDRRFKDKCATLPHELGIKAEESPYLKKVKTADARESIQATLEYWFSINGKKATVIGLCAILSKNKYSALAERFKPYLEHRIIPDVDVKPFQLDPDTEEAKEPSFDEDDFYAKMSGMTMEEMDTEGFCTEDTIIIDGMKDDNDPVRDKKNVQLMLDKHNCSLKVVESRRIQGQDKQFRSLKVKMKAKQKTKMPLKSLLNRTLATLKRSSTLSKFSLTVSEFNPNTVKCKKNSLLTNIFRLGGQAANLALHYFSDTIDQHANKRR